MRIRIPKSNYEIDRGGLIYHCDSGDIYPPIETSAGQQSKLFIDGQYRTRMTHLYVAEAYLPKPTDEKNRWVVKHLDGNKSNNSVSNLKWISRSESSAESGQQSSAPGAKPISVNSGCKKLVCTDLMNLRSIRFNSLKEASLYLKSIMTDDIGQTETIASNISKHLSDGKKFIYGFHWDWE